MNSVTAHRRHFVCLAAIICLGLVFVSPMRAESKTRPSPTQLSTAEPQKFSEKFEIAAGHEETWTFTPGVVPGVLSGQWSSEGKSANIKGAKDDTLVSFKITGPNNEILQKQMDHPVSGNFRIRCENDGKITLHFINSGIIRSSARNVTLDGTYKPD